MYQSRVASDEPCRVKSHNPLEKVGRNLIGQENLNLANLGEQIETDDSWIAILMTLIEVKEVHRTGKYNYIKTVNLYVSWIDVWAGGFLQIVFISLNS